MSLAKLMDTQNQENQLGLNPTNGGPIEDPGQGSGGVPDDTSQGGTSDDPPTNPGSGSNDDDTYPVQGSTGNNHYPQFRLAFFRIIKEKSPLFKNFVSNDVYALVPHATANIQKIEESKVVAGIKTYLSELTFLYGGANNKLGNAEIYPVTYEFRPRVFLGQAFLPPPQSSAQGTEASMVPANKPQQKATNVTYIIHDVRQVYKITGEQNTQDSQEAQAENFSTQLNEQTYRYFVVVARPPKAELKPTNNNYFVGIVARPNQTGVANTPQLYADVLIKADENGPMLKVYNSKEAKVLDQPQAILQAASEMTII